MISDGAFAGIAKGVVAESREANFAAAGLPGREVTLGDGRAVAAYAITILRAKLEAGERGDVVETAALVAPPAVVARRALDRRRLAIRIVATETDLEVRLGAFGLPREPRDLGAGDEFRLRPGLHVGERGEDRHRHGFEFLGGGEEPGARGDERKEGDASGGPEELAAGEGSGVHGKN